MLGYCVGIGIALFVLGVYFIYKHLRKKWNNKKKIKESEEKRE